MCKVVLDKLCKISCNICEKSSSNKSKQKNLRLSLKKMQKKVIIRSGDLGVNLSEFGSQIADKNGWKTSLAVLITLFVAKFTTEFKDVTFLEFPISKSDLSTIFGIFFIFGVMWFIKDVLAYLKNKDAIVDLLELIQEDSINKPDYTAVFIATKKENNQDLLLVSYKKSWNSYFLPYIKRSEHFDLRNIEDYKCYIQNKLKFNSAQVSKINFPIKESEKYDVPENIVKEFHFQFMSLDINGHDIPAEYEWKTIAELVSHENTMKHNNDIISTIISHKSNLIYNDGGYK